ncbi:MAG: chloride channel protein [Pseudomonadota bacterium]
MGGIRLSGVNGRGGVGTALRALYNRMVAILRLSGRRVTTPGLRDKMPFLGLAILVGLATGYVVTGFRVAISFLEEMFYGAPGAEIHSYAAELPWFLVLPVPVIGGLIVGILLARFTPDGKARGVADVIRASAVGRGRIDRGPGLASAGAALVTLSTGGSTGREGPAVHLGAVIASWVSEKLRLGAVSARDILGCAAAAAVSASFNAPLAGALFAQEVVLRHFAMHAFGPIVLASVTAAVVSRLHLGNVTEFALPVNTIGFYTELPAFMLLGALAGITAVAMMRVIFLAESIGDRVQHAAAMPIWLRPAVAGLLLGAIALGFPHIIGVGYETTNRALTSEVSFWAAVVLVAVKIVAVAVTFAGRMGGGVFSPALMVGALLGTAFGSVAIALVPSVDGSQGLYAVAGMGAVAAAVLGAPISSTLIIIELTGDWQAGLAVLVSVAIASVIADRLVARSFFLTQLERQGLHLADGPQGYLASTKQVVEIMRPRGDPDCAQDEACWTMHGEGAWLSRSDTLEDALARMKKSNVPFLPVIRRPAGDDAQPELVGALFLTDALRAYADLLEEELREEHT